MKALAVGKASSSVTNGQGQRGDVDVPSGSPLQDCGKGDRSGGWEKDESLVLIPASCWDCPRLLHRTYLRMSQLWK